MDAMLNSIPPSEPQIGESAEDGSKESYLQLVPAVDQAIRLLFGLANTVGGEGSLTELSKEVGISKSKGLAILNTLRNAGLVMRNERTKNYRLGPSILTLTRALTNNTDLAQSVYPYLEDLAAQTGCSFHLGVVSGDTLFVIARRHAPGGTYIAVDVGHRYPLTWGAHGRAYLATLPQEEFERRLEQSSIIQAGETDRDGIDRDVLQRQVDEARELGYGMNLGTTWSGLNAVSAPIYIPAADAVGGRRAVAYLVAVSNFSVERAHQIGRLMLEVTTEMSQKLGPMFEAVNLHFPLSRPLFL
ncbi:MAG: IclR family transcriptional regulator [Thermoleophilia bacterium]|nr:IclR family transcriptional regulator [Thermoleophilia bacterium]